jgi:hypothetical protein
MWPCIDVSCKLGLVCTRVSTRAGWTPSIGTIAGSIQINEERLSPLYVPNFRMKICRHLGAIIVFSMAFMSKTWSVMLSFRYWSCVCSRLSLRPPVGWVGAVSLYPVERPYGLSAGG